MKNTANLNLKKPDQTDYVNIGDLNDNMDVIDEVVQEALTRVKGLDKVENTSDLDKPISRDTQNALNETKEFLDIHENDLAKHVSIKEREKWNKVGEVEDLMTTSKTDIVTAVNELFTNVSDSKSLIANAIIDKGITVSTSDDFTQLATAISNIDTGKKSAQGTMMMPSANRNLIVRGLIFKPRVVVYSYYRGGFYHGVYSASTPSISSVLTRNDNYWYSIIPVTIYDDGFMVSGLVSSGSDFSDIAVVWSAFE